MSDDLGPWDAWQALIDLLAALERQRLDAAVDGINADADVDGWLAALWAALAPADTVTGPAWCSGPDAGRPTARPAAAGRALPARPAASRRVRRDGR